jgi:hypothetical protein
MAWNLLDIKSTRGRAQESRYDFFASVSMVNPDEFALGLAIQ